MYMKNSVLKKYSDAKIRTKTIIILIIFTLIPSICITLVGFFSTNRISDEFISSHIESRNKTTEYNFNKYFERVSTNYINILSNNSFFVELEQVYETSSGIDLLSEILNETVDDYIENVDIVSPEGEVYRCLGKNNIKINDSDFYSKKAGTNNLREMVSDSDGDFYFVLRRKLINMFNGNDDGTIILYIPERELCKIFGSSNDADMLFLTDKEGKVLSSHDKSRIGSGVMYAQINSDKAIEFSVNDEEYHMYRYKISSKIFEFNEDIYVVGIISLIYIERMKEMILISMGMIILFMVVIIPCVAVGESKRAVHSILTLQKNMERFALGQSFKRGKINTGSDEMAMLEKSFDDMVDRINLLVAEKNVQEEKQRMAELDALQAQINPHFIYNTLDSISWLAQMNNNTDIAEIVQALSKFFRISLHNGKKHVTVLQELEHVKSYLTVMEFRYRGTFKVVFNVEKELEQELVLKTILQPIVENAINHGIRPLDRPGKICVNIKSDGEFILLEVKDDGVGFDVNNPPKRRTGGFGLKNVISRIEMEYGKECGVQIQSAPEKGTSVSLRVRKKDSGDN